MIREGVELGWSWQGWSYGGVYGLMPKFRLIDEPIMIKPFISGVTLANAAIK